MTKLYFLGVIFFKKWFKIIFIFPYGQISSPFLNKKAYIRSSQQKSQKVNCFVMLLITDLRQSRSARRST